MTVPPQIEENLETRLKSAIKHANDMNQRGVDVYAEIAKEKTQYFEKIALASAGTIALVVSFVGSHAGRLQPPCLLRSALIMLVLAMVIAMYRNWRYPYYLTACYSKQNYIAMRHREQCRLDLLVTVPALSMQDGKPIDIEKARDEFGKVDKEFEGEIAKFQKQETSVFNLVRQVERVALTLIVTGMVLLIALAWRNF
jgi:hypothetical protein